MKVIQFRIFSHENKFCSLFLQQGQITWRLALSFGPFRFEFFRKKKKKEKCSYFL